MADNRMFLVHKPTGLGVCLGKRMDWGWYNPPSESEMQHFFDYLKTHPEGSQDDFVLLMEDCGESSCIDEWHYAGRVAGFHVFAFDAAHAMEPVENILLPEEVHHMLHIEKAWSEAEDGHRCYDCGHHAAFHLTCCSSACHICSCETFHPHLSGELVEREWEAG